MPLTRKLPLIVAGVLLPILLFAVAIDVGVLKVFGSADGVKSVLTNSGIYNSVVSNGLDQTQRVTTPSGGEVSLTDPQIKQAAQSVFTPSFIQQNTNKVIDGIYDWLDGKTAQPDFKVDISSQKNSLAAKIGQVAKRRASYLPGCNLGFLPASTDPFKINCLPQGVTAAEVGNSAQNAVLSGQGFLDNTVITANSLKSSNTNQPVFSNQLKDLPTQYRRAKKTPVILIILALVDIAAIIFLARTKRWGIRHVGVTLVTVGVLLFVLAWALNRAAVHLRASEIKVNNLILQNSIKSLSSYVAHRVTGTYLLFGAIYLVLGAAAIGGVLLLNKKRPIEKVAN